jgi:hypothetical protein
MADADFEERRSSSRHNVLAAISYSMKATKDRHRQLANLDTRFRRVAGHARSRWNTWTGDFGADLKGSNPSFSILNRSDVITAKMEEVIIRSWADRNRCAWPGDLKRFICRSRLRVD